MHVRARIADHLGEDVPAGQVGQLLVAGSASRRATGTTGSDGGSENVYPAEIENVLHHHPAVAEAAVVGVPDPKWGERRHAFVVGQDGAAPDPEELRGFVHERLAGYKVPRTVALVSTLPRNNTGKIVKSSLRAAAASGEHPKVT